MVVHPDEDFLDDITGKLGEVSVSISIQEITKRNFETFYPALNPNKGVAA